ncbi:MAG: hypothetical protein WBD47_14655 [Phormidesmis sp.]
MILMTMRLAIEQIGQVGQLKNFLSSAYAYADMSPDITIRKKVNDWMLRRDRSSLSLSDWCQLYSTQAQAYSVLSFIYQSFSQYSGLDFSRVRPDDQLNRDLHFPLVCWFDWSITFCEDFFQQFDLDLSDRFDEASFSTIGEMVNFLIAQMSQSNAEA